MATSDDFASLLASLGYDSSTNYDVPDNPADAALAGIDAFIREHSDERERYSTGIIHITGPSILGNSAPVKAVGYLLTSVQNTIDAIGASIQDIKTTRGAIPIPITERTEMSLVASPMPGSIVLQVAPTMSRIEDLNPEGPPLFDVEKEAGARPLIDIAFGEFSSLVQDLSNNKPDNPQLIDRLTNLGPRVASTMKEFCKSVDKGAIDVELKWKEPEGVQETSSLSHTYAKQAAKIIEDANIENEEVTIEGNLLTVTTSQKDKLRVSMDDGKEVVVSIEMIDAAALLSLRAGDRVQIRAERRTSSRPGGRQTEKLIGISVQKNPKLME